LTAALIASSRFASASLQAPVVATAASSAFVSPTFGSNTATAARRRRSLEDLFLDEAMSRIGEDVARDTKVVLELLKSAVRLMR
jgi:hypothetical protein